MSCLVSCSVSCWNVGYASRPAVCGASCRAVYRAGMLRLRELSQCIVPRTCRAVCRAGMLQYMSCAAWNLVT